MQKNAQKYSASSLICDPIQGNHSKSHIRQNKANTTSIYSHTTVLLVSSLNFSLRLIVAGVNSWLCIRLGWRFQAMASVWAGNIQCCCFFSSQSKHPQYRFCFISTIKEPAQPFQAGFWASLVPHHHFLPFHHPPPTECKHPRYYLANPTS